MRRIPSFMRPTLTSLAGSCLIIVAACTSEDPDHRPPPAPSAQPSAGVVPIGTAGGGETVAPSGNVTTGDTVTAGPNADTDNSNGSETNGTADTTSASDADNTSSDINGDESDTGGGLPTTDSPGDEGTTDVTAVPSGGSSADATDVDETGETDVDTTESETSATSADSDTTATADNTTTDTTTDTSDAPANEPTCPMPTSFRWTSTGPIAQPRAGWASIKDFTAVFHEDQYIVYMTNHDTGTSWGAAMFTFGDWSQAATATQHPMDRTSVAPTLFYFEPKDVWVLAYQWGRTSFSYATSNDPTDPDSWSAEQNLYNYTGSLPNSGTGPIDQHVICDDTDCYLFFNGDNGEIYRSSMPIEDFPGTFGPHETIMSRSTNELFEAVAVYSIKGSDEYLMLMESIGSNGRYFSAFTASDLGGQWTDLKTRENDPFAGRVNVTFEGNAWSTDISHGDIVRRNPDQTMEIDFCNIELLYQGRDPGINPEYGLLPYRPGVLTLQR